MYHGLAYASIAVSLALAVWALIACGRQRSPDRGLFLGLGVVGAILGVEAIIGLVRLAAGYGPHDGDTKVTFVGYALTTGLLPWGGWVLARMEPTRWGSALIGAAALVAGVLVVRMLQVWAG